MYLPLPVSYTHLDVYKRQVMNLWLVSLGAGFLLLGFLLLLPGPSWMMVLFILCYTFSFVATILLVQWKYGRQVLKDGPVQRSEWRPGLIWGVLFCLQPVSYTHLYSCAAAVMTRHPSR